MNPIEALIEWLVMAYRIRHKCTNVDEYNKLIDEYVMRLNDLQMLPMLNGGEDAAVHQQTGIR